MHQNQIAQEPRVDPLLFQSYLAVIKNSIGSHQFRSFYALVDGVETDILNNGVLSCAFFVTSILKMFDLIVETHTTVTGTLADLEKSGWQQLESPKVGCVLVWEPKTFENNTTHSHVGFYVGDDTAISNSATAGMPQEHHWTFGHDAEGRPARKVIGMWWNERSL